MIERDTVIKREYVGNGARVIIDGIPATELEYNGTTEIMLMHYVVERLQYIVDQAIAMNMLEVTYCDGRWQVRRERNLTITIIVSRDREVMKHASLRSYGAS